MSLLLSLLLPAALAAPDACDDGAGSLEGFALAVDAMDGHVVGQGGETIGRQVVVGDFDGNSTPDVAVSGDMAKVNGLQSGAVYVFLDADPTAVLDPAAADAVLEGPRGYERMGFALAVGDVDLDGVDDLVAGGLGQVRGSGWVYAVSGVRITTGGPIDVISESVATWRSPTRYDGFGANVAVMDVNDDDIPDVVVGAPNDDTNAKDAGAMHVFLGPAAGDYLKADAAATLLGTVAGGKLGDEVGSLGDMDGDGFAEVGAGAYLDATGGSNAGALYVLRGGAWELTPPGTVDATAADLRLFGAAGERLGRAFGSTGDGTGDIWVSAVRAGTSKQGAVYRIPGSTPDGGAPVAAIQDFELQGFESGGVLGGSLTVGDVDGDGTPDLVAGAPYATGSTRYAGAVIVAFGPFTGSSRLATGAGIGKLGGTVYKQDLGAAVAVADLDGDGFDDVLGGAPRDPAEGLNGGRVYVFRGGADSADLITFYADDDSDGFGSNTTTTTACSDDPPVGAWLTTSGDCVDDPGLSGGLYYPGAPEGCADPDYNCDGATGNVDGDGDGYDACEGDCDDDDASVNPGADELCGDGIDNDCVGGIDDAGAVDAQTWYIDADGDGFGYDLIPLTQCDAPVPGAFTYTQVGGDCLDSSLDPDAPSVNPDAVEVCGDGLDNDCANGIDDPAAVNAYTWYADDDSDGFGDAFTQQLACTQPLGAWVLDFSDCDDTDGAVKPGVPETCDGKDNDCDGLFYLGGSLDLAADVFRAFDGPVDGAKLGQGNVTVVGDQDLDGDGEIVVAYPSADLGASNVGVVLVIDGQTDGGTKTLDPEASVAAGAWSTRIRGTGTNMELGRGIATGDVNGDLVADLVVGAPGARFPSYQQGGVFVFFGPLPDGDLTVASANVVIEGHAASARSGASLAVGDVDADGYDDIVIGSPGATVDGLGESGQVQVVYGRSAGDWLAATPLELALDADAYSKGRAGDRAGNDVAVLDLDGDTAADIVFGSTRAGTLSAGRMYVAYGQPVLRRTGELAHAASYVGAQFNEQLTFSLASAGDVDADGDDDLLVSTNYNRAWLVMGDSTRLDGVDASIATATALRFDGALGAQAGERSTGIGDVNGDGFADMAFDAVDDDGAGRDAGAVWVVYGREDFTEVVPFGGSFALNTVEAYGPATQANSTLEGAKISGSAAFDAFGSAVGGGDIDGDGFADLVAGASGADSGGLSDNGRVAVFRGGPFGADLGVSDGSEADWFADVDGDGFTLAAPVAVATCPMHAPEGSGTTASAVADCDDDRDDVFPANPAEVGGDGVDSNCDGFDIPNPNADSDGDGLTDGDESTVTFTDPVDPDSDDDGVSDGDEVNRVPPTDPLDDDSDDDGYTDGKELENGTDPLDAASPALVGEPGGPVVVQISAGATYSCALFDDGTVSCWGRDAYGESTVPPVPVGKTYTAVSAGGGHTCAFVSDGALSCWGADGAAQTTVPTPPAGETFVSVSAGASHTCALASNGTVSCWGYDADGQATVPAPPAGQTYASVTAGRFHSCALVSNGTVSCWGANHAGQVTVPTAPAGASYVSVDATMDSTCALVSDGTVNCWGSGVSPVPAAPVGESYVSVLAGGGHACALVSDGTVACWGTDGSGESTVPSAPAGETYVAVDLGFDHTCALASDGTVSCWGDDGYGRATVPSAPAGETYVSVSADLRHTCAVVSDGSIACWGRDTYGQSTVPAAPVGETYEKVTTGADHTCALLSDGTLSCWGSGGFGQTAVPPAPGGLAWVDVSAGDVHTCALASDGTVSCWGNDGDGEATPPSAPAGETFLSVSGGAHHTCALVSNGTVSCWGLNTSGQSTAPSAPAGEAFVAVSTGGYHACALVSDGTVSCWGYAGWGQLAVPAVPAGETYVAVSSGDSHTCVLASDGSVACFGRDNQGQATVPAPPEGETYVAVSAGLYHSCALVSDGQERCWGEEVRIGTDFASGGPPLPAVDTDLDGLSDHSESLVGTNPTLADTDGDGLSDGFEVGLGTNPLVADTDGDGDLDGDEVDAASDPLESCSLVAAPAANGVCDDGDACNGAEVCVGGLSPAVCSAGTPVVVDDGVACTVDSCDPATGIVTNAPADGLCSDGEFCNGAEVCDPGVGCLAGAPPVVDDGQACTIDSCDEVNDAVVNQPKPCSDGQFCNGLETCDPGNGFCISGPAPTISDGSVCTADYCDEALDEVVHSPDPVDDGVACTVDTCDPILGLSNTPDDGACGAGEYCDPVTDCTPVVLDVLEVSAGSAHTCAVVSDGSVSCWGWDNHGQSTAPSAPVGETFVSVSAGESHTCALVSDGSVSCWGRDVEGQSTVPPAPVGETYISLSAGYAHTCATVSDGSVSCWGLDTSGQSTVPSAPVGETYVSSSAGWYHSCAAVSDGSVSCWGSNTYGQSTAPSAPVGETYVSLSAGGNHTCAVVSDGSVSCWGLDNHGQSTVPSAPVGETYVSSDAGYDHTCAVVSDGSVSCWGRDAEGQSTVPSAPVGETYVSSSAGGLHSCAVVSDGSVSCWGLDAYGQSTVPPL